MKGVLYGVRCFCFVFAINPVSRVKHENKHSSVAKKNVCSSDQLLELMSSS